MTLRLASILLLALPAFLMPARASDLSERIPVSSTVLPGYNDIDSIMDRIDDRGPVDIEGIWNMTASQTLVVIEPASHPSLSGAGYKAMQIVIISSPRKSMRPGTVLGYIVPTARRGYYEARIYTSNVRSILQKHRKYTLNLTDESHLTMTPDKSPWRITLRHSLKFLLRAGIYNRQSDEPSFDGFIKQYPSPDGPPLNPVYL